MLLHIINLQWTNVVLNVALVNGIIAVFRYYGRYTVVECLPGAGLPSVLCCLVV